MGAWDVAIDALVPEVLEAVDIGDRCESLREQNMAHQVTGTPWDDAFRRLSKQVAPGYPERRACCLRRAVHADRGTCRYKAESCSRRRSRGVPGRGVLRAG